MKYNIPHTHAPVSIIWLRQFTAVAVFSPSRRRGSAPYNVITATISPTNTTIIAPVIMSRPRLMTPFDLIYYRIISLAHSLVPRCWTQENMQVSSNQSRLDWTGGHFH